MRDKSNPIGAIILKFSTTVKKSTIDDEMVLMDTINGEYYGLNATGTVLLEALLETQDSAAAVARAAELFDAPAETIAADLQVLVEELLARELVKSIITE